MKSGLGVILALIANSSAIPQPAIALENRLALELGDILKPIIECLMNNISQVPQEDLTLMLQKLKEALLKLGGCFNVNVNDATENDVVTLLQCLLAKLGEASREDLSDIITQLQPVLTKVQSILDCTKNVLRKLCNGLCNIPGVNICGSSILGIDLLRTILEILNPVVYLLLCRLIG